MEAGGNGRFGFFGRRDRRADEFRFMSVEIYWTNGVSARTMMSKVKSIATSPPRTFRTFFLNRIPAVSNPTEASRPRALLNRIR